MRNFFKLFLFLCLTGNNALFAQSTLSGNTPTNPNLRDTSMNKSNTSKWKDEEAKITYEKLNSARIYVPDTSLHTFQRPRFTQPWYRDLGNLGSPAHNWLFTPEYRVGPTLGYHSFDIYRFNVDSLNFYNTTRPYSVFTYQLGSKLEQCASLMHTQNIKPNWNFAVEYRKTNSPGYYKTQRTNNDNAMLSTNYKSLGKHYTLYGAVVYNKEQNDENGGLANYNQLADPVYGDRRTIDAVYQNTQYSLTRSPVSNVLRDFAILLQHSYTFGRSDTTYNADSTHYTYQLKPAFSITHKLKINSERHTYTDLAPDSLNYSSLFTHSFANGGSGYYTAGEDSVLTRQKWFRIDNQFLLNGFLGKVGKQLQFTAGLGTRFDEFISQPVATQLTDSLPRVVYSYLPDRSKIFSNYLVGEIKKEALQPGQWGYGAGTRFFLTGTDAGNFTFDAFISKQFKNNSAGFAAGFQQQLNSAPYSYTNYENNYTKQFFAFNNESVTSAYAALESSRLRLSGGVRNYLVGNYIYINDSANVLIRPAQYNVPFSITQGWLRKVFKVGSFYLDNELLYQAFPLSAPINVPTFMGRHQLTYERDLFRRALKIVFGVEVRYNSVYYVSGYDPLLNQFYYQHTIKTAGGYHNAQEESIFLNFRVKRFRAFIMGDNLQEIFARNTILYAGNPIPNYNNTGIPLQSVYAAPNAMIRFGFNWVLVN